MNKVLTLALLALWLLIGCKRYDEGPGLSLRSVKARLIGNWKLKEVSNEEGENMGMVTYSNPRESWYCDKALLIDEQTFYESYTLTFSDCEPSDCLYKTFTRQFTRVDLILNSDSTRKVCTPVYDERAYTSTIEGSWTLKEDKEVITLSYEAQSTGGMGYGGSYMVDEHYTILRLTNKELKITDEYGYETLLFTKE